MPTLTWANKSPGNPTPATLNLVATIHPQGAPFSDQFGFDHLYLGDNLQIMARLLDQYENKINLIYADPPFFTNKTFSARIGRGEDSRQPENWQLDQGYTDHWSGDLDAYLDFLYPRLVLMHRLLAPTGSLYLHLDWHADAYARLLLDEIFGRDRLINQIAWCYHGPSPIRNAFNRKHDTLFLYSKSRLYQFNSADVREPYHPSTIKTFASSSKAGFGKVPDLERGKVPEDWWYFPVVARLHNERTGYPTQKPAALLERILRASSNSGDLVADFFCGSGTTPLMAAKLGRRFLAADANWRAVHTTRARLVNLPSRPFQVWQSASSPIPSDDGNLPISLVGDTLSLQPDPDLDYWEVDQNWNGRDFTSSIQNSRPLRGGELPVSALLTHPGRRILVRAVSVHGKTREAELSFPGR